MSTKNLFIVNLAPTGMIPTKKMTTHVPVTPKEIASTVRECLYDISMVHIHARDEIGKPTYKRDVYAQIISAIREVNEEIIICVSTSGRIWSEFDKRAEVLDLESDLKPDMASLTLSSLNFNKQASINEPQMVRDLARKMLDNGIKPELEVFDTGMMNYAHYLVQREFIRPPYYFNLILGNVACAQATPGHLSLLLNELPDNSFWSVGGVGDYQLTANMLGMVCGGGVRVGLEDNIWNPGRERLATNRGLLVRLKLIAGLLELQVATPREVRKWLDLPQKSQ